MAANVHAGCVIIGDHGVLIRGASGSGKSTLALSLLRACRGFASLVSDDRTELTVRSGRLVARGPAAIAGLVEIRGHGIVVRPFRPAAVVDLVITLVPDEEAERLPDLTHQIVEGVRLRSLELGARSAYAAIDAVLAATELEDGR